MGKDGHKSTKKCHVLFEWPLTSLFSLHANCIFQFDWKSSLSKFLSPKCQCVKVGTFFYSKNFDLLSQAPFLCKYPFMSKCQKIDKTRFCSLIKVLHFGIWSLLQNIHFVIFLSVFRKISPFLTLTCLEKVLPSPSSPHPTLPLN